MTHSPRRLKLVSSLLSALLSLMVATDLRATDTPGAIRYNADGSFTIDSTHFPSMADYIGSDIIRTANRRCGTAGIDPETAMSLQTTTDCSAQLTQIQQAYWPQRVMYLIPVVVHVIVHTNGTGDVSDRRIMNQIIALNEDFRALANSLGAQGSDTRIQFELVEITRTIHDTWHADSDETGYKTTLGRDQSRYLNIYVNTASGYLGYAYLPFTGAGQTLDGITINYEAIGGRNEGAEPYNQGRTLTHEVGHYLGLLHTFEGYSCSNGYDSGDLLMDTPAENTDHYGCTPTESCGTPDAIENYMNYTDDRCMERFSSEQANRMVCALTSYRPHLYRTVILGDFDGNGEVGLNDLILSLQVLTNQTPVIEQLEADATRDLQIGLQDTLYILDELGAR